MWCWYRQVTLTANAVYFLIAWPGGVREGRAAFATVSALPSHKVFKLPNHWRAAGQFPASRFSETA